jgi:hypothetical protein
VQEFLEAHPFEEPIDDGQGTDAIGGEGSPLGASEFTGAWVVGGTRNMALFGFFHPCSPDEGVADEGKLRPEREEGFPALIPANMIVRRKNIVKVCTNQFSSLMICFLDVSGLELNLIHVRTLLKSRLAVKAPEISPEKRGFASKIPIVFLRTG